MSDPTVDQLITQLHALTGQTIDYTDTDTFIAHCQQCNKLIQQLITQQPTPTTSPLPTADAILQFEQYIVDASPINTGLNHVYAIDIDNMSTLQPHKSNGLITAKSITTNELCINIPRTLMLCSDTIHNTAVHTSKADKLFYALLAGDAMLQQDASMTLTLLLYHHKHILQSKSPHTPYINILPHTHTIPLYHSVDELVKWLQGGSTLMKALQHQYITIKQYSYIHQLFTQHQLTPPTYTQFIWCIATVCTRQNNVPVQHKLKQDSADTQMGRALIPLFDLANHSHNGTLTTDYNTTTHSLESYSTHPLSIAQPLFMSYGQRSNTELYIYQGFVDDANPHNTYDMTVTIPNIDTSTQLFKIQFLILRKVQMSIHTVIQLPLPSPPTTPYSATALSANDKRWYNMLHWLRVAVLCDADMQYALTSQAHHKQAMLVMPLSRPNEQAAFNLLKSLVQMELIKFGTPLEVDEELLQQPGGISTESERLAIRQRVNDKRVLHGGIQQCGKWVRDVPTFVVDELPSIGDYQ